MLNKWNLKMAQFASKDKACYGLNVIRVEQGATVATNGYFLGWISTPKGREASSFPDVAGFPKPTDEYPPFLLGMDSAKQIEKALPKKTIIPVLDSAAIAVEGTSEAPTMALCVTDLNNPQVFRPAPANGPFPNYDMIIPKDKPIVRLAVSATYLAQIAKLAAEFSGQGAGRDALEISLYGANGVVDPRTAIRFDCHNDDTDQGMTVVLMPRPLGESFPANTYGNAQKAEVTDEQAAD